MLYMYQLDDLAAIIPYIIEAVKNRCGINVDVYSDYPNEIRLCTYKNCITIRKEGDVVLYDEYSNMKVNIGDMTINEAIKNIAYILCK